VAERSMVPLMPEVRDIKRTRSAVTPARATPRKMVRRVWRQRLRAAMEMSVLMDMVQSSVAMAWRGVTRMASQAG
jgi:hypothetical protein